MGATLTVSLSQSLTHFFLDSDREVLYQACHWVAWPRCPSAGPADGCDGGDKPTDILLVMCRSGGRSALAVNQLAEVGFRIRARDLCPSVV